MAVIDPRLSSLIDTLASVGADWLAFELLDTIRSGIEAEESEEVLAVTRAKVRHRENDERVLVTPGSSPKKLVGDHQIAWAADYVADRLEGTISDLIASHAALQTIGDTEPPEFAVYDADEAQTKSRVKAPDPVNFKLDDPGTEPVSLEELHAAMSEIRTLRSALDQWRKSVAPNGAAQ